MKLKITRKIYECKNFSIGYCGSRSFLVITKNKKPSIENKIEAIQKLLTLIDLKTENIPTIEEKKNGVWRILAKW